MHRKCSEVDPILEGIKCRSLLSCRRPTAVIAVEEADSFFCFQPHVDEANGSKGNP